MMKEVTASVLPTTSEEIFMDLVANSAWRNKREEIVL